MNYSDAASLTDTSPPPGLRAVTPSPRVERGKRRAQ